MQHPALRLSAVTLVTIAAAFAPPLPCPAAEPLPKYTERQDLTYYLDAAGQKRSIESPADWAIRRGHLLAGMQQVMGDLPGDGWRVPLDVQTVEESRVGDARVGDARLGDIVRRKITYQTDPDDRVTAWLFLPPGAGPAPAVLCLHQTTRHGKDEPAGVAGSGDLAYALELAQRGFVTLAPDFPSFGEHDYDFAPSHGYVSGTMKGIWDNIRSIDVLETLPQVDANRIGCIGHSLGGHMTMFTAAFEPRIKALVSSCGFCTFQKDDVPSWTGRVYMPRIASDFDNDANRLPFDFTEILAGFAPRPFLACAATRDDDFDASGVRDCIDAAQPIYALHGAADNLQAIYPDAPHSFPPDARKTAYKFLEAHLRP